MELFRKLRAILRGLSRQPMVSLLSLGILGLTITFSLAVFTILDAALLRPFPLIDTERWVYLWEEQRRDGEIQRVGASIPNYLDWRAQSQTVEEMVAWNEYAFTVSGSDSPPAQAPASVTTVNLFAASGLPPQLGRWLNDEDSKAAARHVVISHRMWHDRFGGDREVVGKSVELNLVPHEIVGVAPPLFTFPPERPTDIWLAMPGEWLSGARDRSSRGFRVAGLLRKNVTPGQADDDLNRIAAQLAATYREDEGYGVEVLPMREAVSGDLRTPLLLLAGALALVLLLGCANVAHLRLAALEARRSEFATRLALGASRTGLGRMLLSESFVLGVASAAIGVALAMPAAQLLLRLAPQGEMPWLQLHLDGRAVLVAAVTVLVVTLITSLAPLALISKTRLYEAFRVHGAGAVGSQAWRRVFVVAQVALAMLPLVGATVLVRSYVRLQERDPGFDPTDRATYSYSAPRARYPEFAAQRDLADRMERALQAVPGVEAAGLVSSPPFGGGVRWYQAVTRENPSQLRNVGTLPFSRFSVVTPGFFTAIGAKRLEGEFFGPLDVASGRRVAVINETAAKMFFPGESAVGKQFWIGHAEGLPGSDPRTVVAVVQDLRLDNLTDETGPQTWVPLHQETLTSNVWRALSAIVKTSGAPSQSAEAIRAAFASVDADLALMNQQSMERQIADSLWQSRLLSVVFGGFAVVAMLLAALGVFALSAFLAQRRAREFGIRVALGAQSGDIAKLILLDDIATLAAAFAVGLLAAFGCGRALRSVLFEVAPDDPWMLAGATGLLLVSIASARLAASMRATAVNPAHLLRES